MTELSNMRRVRRAGARAPYVLGLLLAGALHAGCSVGDQFCKPGADPTDPDDACPYGPPNGPQRSPASITCGSINSQRTPVATADCVTWSTLYTDIIDNGMTGKCTNTGCHGGTSSNAGLNIDDADPAAAFADLAGYTNVTFGGGYINAADAEEDRMKSWFPCNVEGIEQGGSPMPPANGLVAEADRQKVMNWFLCWVKDPMAYGPGGMGTGAGGGGTGGGGGVGGGM